MRKQLINITLKITFAVWLCFFTDNTMSQTRTIVVDSSSVTHRTVVAGDYQRSAIHNFLFGRNYRKEWSAAVQVPVMKLDTAHGGLVPYKSGGGRQTRSLRLHDTAGREYVLRSVDKSFGRALPPIFLNTFIEDIVDDQVTIGNPYTSLTIAPLADAAGVYHAVPEITYVPQQPSLDSFSDKFGDNLYILEQRPDDDWETADNFGDARKIISSEKMLRKLLKDNDRSVDQLLYVRSRLFDMFIGDWGRHEDQWRWGVFKDGKRETYKPIPRDRDQAYSKFGGMLTVLFIRAADLDHLQSFGYNINGIKVYGYTARHLDRQCANEPTRQQWVDIAKDMQAHLTDEAIEQAVKQLPQEVFPISGNEIIARLRSRRDHLLDFALRYYAFLARHVDIAGTEDREYFEVKRLNDDETSVNVYKINKQGRAKDTPFYSRVFNTGETKDIRLYGIGGVDKFSVEGDTRTGINVRIIGGTEIDTIIDRSRVSGARRKTNVYDDKNNSSS